MNNKTDLIELGVITKAHGIKGQVTIKPFGDDPLALNQYGPLSDPSGQHTFTIKKIQLNNKGLLVASIQEIKDRNDAEAAKGTLLCIDRDKLPEPEEDEFYYSDLINLEARLETGEAFGKIINVTDFGAGDLLEILPQNSQKSMYLVFNKQNVPALHIKEGYIVVSLPEEIEGQEQKGK